MSLRLHPRDIIQRKARNKVIQVLSDIQKEFDLTEIEMLQLVRELESDHVDNFFKYQLRYERHGNFDTPSGLVGDNEA